MNKTVVASISIIALTVLICCYIYSQNNRFVSANAGNGKIYKIDKRTGETVLIYGRRELSVEPSGPPKVESIEDRAIRLAKTTNTLDPESSYPLDNDFHIRESMKEETGSLKIIGWEAQQVDDQTCVVTYSYEKNEEILSYAFEVNLRADIVRNIIGDSELEKEYGFASPSKGVSFRERAAEMGYTLKGDQPATTEPNEPKRSSMDDRLRQMGYTIDDEQ